LELLLQLKAVGITNQYNDKILNVYVH